MRNAKINRKREGGEHYTGTRTENWCWEDGELELREKKSNTRGESRWGSLLTEMIGAFPCIAMGDY